MAKKTFSKVILILFAAALLAPLGSPSVRGVEFTEDLWEITDEGVYDPSGNPVDVFFEEEELLPPMLPAQTSEDSFEAYRQTLLNNWGGQKAFTEERLRNIRRNLEEELKRFETVSDDIQGTEGKLEPLDQEIRTLTDQINLFNEQLRLTREKILGVERQVAERELKIRDVMLEVQKKEVALRAQEEAVLDYISLLYTEEAEFMDLYSGGSSTVKLLLADRSVSENLLGRDYVAVIEKTGRQVFHELDAATRELKEEQATLLLSQAKLNRLYATLGQEKQMMEETRSAKKELLEKTQGQKEEYEKLLEESIHQQLESALAIQNLKDNVELIESKLEILEEKIESEKALEPPTPLIPQVEEPESRDQPFFSWPVRPNKLTAAFQDPTYPKRWGIHNAIDIRAKQFTEIHAPANGYVVEAKDNGLGYSYIILAHKRNLVTVYGHVSEIRVRPGMLVREGDVIGLTGGTPGTRGAGLQTTGPHLHFEVHEKGEPKNPLDYLPIYEMPIEYVPAEYLMKEE